MNYQKEQINNSWLIRAHLRFLWNGIVKCIKSIWGILGIIAFFMVLYYGNTLLKYRSYELKGMEYIANRTNAFVFTFIVIVALIIYLLMYGKPKGVGISKYIRIGFSNSAGETPLLLERTETNKGLITLTFRNVGIPLDVWKDNKGQLESILNINILNIEENGKRCIVIMAASGDLVIPKHINWDNSFMSNETFELICGETYVGRIGFNLAVTPHVLIGGSTGSGKSVLLKLLLMQCVKKGAKVVIIDFKGGVDFAAEIWHKECMLVTDKETALQTLKYCYKQLFTRQDTLNKSYCRNIDDYNEKHPEKQMKRIIIGCDELAELLDKSGLDKEQKSEVAKIEAYLSSIARLGRACGIHLILATQRPDANIINGQIKNNADIRICGRADNVLSQIILDNTEASDKISPYDQGRFLNNEDFLFQAYYLNEDYL